MSIFSLGSYNYHVLSTHSRDRIGMIICRTCDVQQKTLIRPRISDIDRTAEAGSAFLIGRPKRLWRKFAKTGDRAAMTKIL
jgi:hypothetical protein